MMTDSQFAKSFLKMIAFLVVLTLVLITLGAVIGSSLDDKLRAQSEEFTQRVVASRTEPIGQLNVGAIPEPESLPEKPQPTQLAATNGDVGQSVYDKSCHDCHTTGVTGAPKLGDVANWAPSIERGIEALYANAINGYQGEAGVMPPKGGNLLLSDDEVKAAVDYMVKLSQ